MTTTITKPPYCPERGDIVWLDFDPVLGHEQRGHRPALVLTRAAFNQKVKLCLACPITSTVRGDPFDVTLPADLQIGKGQGGAIRAHHLRSVSWATRKVQFIVRCPNPIIADVQAKLRTLLF